MDADLYYTPPSDEVFEEIKAKAIEIWQTYDDTYGYATRKVREIEHITNISDNAMFMVAMFDLDNQAFLALKLSEASNRAVSERMQAGGQPDWADPFHTVGQNQLRMRCDRARANGEGQPELW